MVEQNLGARSSCAAEADSRVASPHKYCLFIFYNALLFNNTVLSELTNAKTGAGRAVGLDAFATLRLLGLRFYFHLTPGSAADAAAPGANNLSPRMHGAQKFRSLTRAFCSTNSNLSSLIVSEIYGRNYANGDELLSAPVTRFRFNFIFTWGFVRALRSLYPTRILIQPKIAIPPRVSPEQSWQRCRGHLPRQIKWR